MKKEINIMNLLKRAGAYTFDVYFITTLQIVGFAIFRSIYYGEFRLSLVYILENQKLSYFFISVYYFLLCEFFFSKTLGKRIFKLEVIFTKNRFISVLIRTLTRLFPFDLFFILILNNKPLHDILANTSVAEKS
ncbi:RDD family protein [Elizabethkingia meningoseptica]|uniref:RDD family protein n=1 Tax=Elizabethkingia meningoseptica TaxID=238 RepID=UPI0038913BBE